MTSRDERASYYDLELPDGTRTEVWSVLRAVLTPEEALGYVKGCIATRIMRDGKKPDVDRLREAEKVGVEAGMLREAMEAYLAMPGSVAAVAGEDELMTAAEAEEGFSVDARRERLSVLNDMHDEKKRMDAEQREAMSKFLSDPNGDDGPTVNELAWALRDVGKTLGFRANVSTRDEARRVAARIAQLEHERDEYRRLYEAEAAAGQALSETHTRATADYIATTDEADAELAKLRRERDEARETLSRHASAHERHITALARDRDAYCELHAKARAKLNVMTDRYRPRRQSEEPAPRDEVVHIWDTRVNRWMTWPGERVPDDATWTHSPPAPGEGE